MGGLPDQLARPGEEPAGEDGINVLDLAGLPPVQRRIMRLLLREREMPYAALCAAFEELPEPERLERAAIDEALAALGEQRWLVVPGDDPRRVYRVNFRRKTGRVLPALNVRRRSGGTPGRAIWDALDATGGDPPPEEKPPE